MTGAIHNRHADDIRAGAGHLRKLAFSAAEQMPTPWRVVLTDTESFTGVASCQNHEGPSHHACDACHVIETYSEPVAAFIAAMNPTTAILTAHLLVHGAEPGGPDALALARSLTAEQRP